MKFAGVSFCIFISVSALAQINDQGPAYHSEADELIAIDKVSHAPFSDNLNGIYARPLEAHFEKILGQMHRWAASGTVNIGAASLEELEDDPAKTKEIAAGSGTDGFFACKIIKGPKGIAMKLDFFLAKDGKLFLQSEIKDFQQFDLNILKEQLESLLVKVMRKIPYSGRVLSRDVNRVTVNVGSRDGLEKGQVVSVIQLIKLNRHPKFNFLVTAEKEIIGKIKILKVDDTLSFGSVVVEKERGAIQKSNKLDSLEFINYAVNDVSLAPNPDSVDNREDAKVAFGKDAKAWRPLSAPSLGQVGARLGLTRFSQNADLKTGSISAHQDFAPTAFLDGELWLTSNWTIHASMEMAIITTSGSSGSIDESLTAYEMLAGYRFRFGPSAWSPYAEPFFGYMTHRLYADTVTPPAFTTMEYNGFKVGLRGGTPIMDDEEWSVGGSIAFVFSPSLNESPYSSGSGSTNNINQFSVWTAKKMTEHWKLQANLDFEIYSSTFSGSGTMPAPVFYSNSASSQFITLTAGAYYLF